MNVEWILSSSGLILLVLLVRFLFKKRISSACGMPYGWWLQCGFCFPFPYRERLSAF